MTPVHILFLLFAIVILGSALKVVTTKNMLHAALWLIVTLFGVAALYAMLNASFLAVVQVVVYVGAIAILFIFAVMLTSRELRDKSEQLNKNWWAAAIIGVAMFAFLYTLMSKWSGFGNTAAALPANTDFLKELGAALVSPNAYVLPFEIASVLLLAALVGAVYVASNRE